MSFDVWFTEPPRCSSPNDWTEAEHERGLAHFEKFNTKVAENLVEQRDKKYFAGDNLTIADFILFNHYMIVLLNDGNLE